MEHATLLGLEEERARDDYRVFVGVLMIDVYRHLELNCVSKIAISSRFLTGEKRWFVRVPGQIAFH